LGPQRKVLGAGPQGNLASANDLGYKFERISTHLSPNCPTTFGWKCYGRSLKELVSVTSWDIAACWWWCTIQTSGWNNELTLYSAPPAELDVNGAIGFDVLMSSNYSAVRP